MAAAGGLSAAGNIGSALIGSNAAGNAAQQAVAGQNAALMYGIGGQESATSALSPYYTGGLGNYDFLQYLMGANAPAAATWTDANQAQMDALQSYINNYGGTRGGQSGKYGAVLANAQSQLAQLQQQQQAAQSSTQANAQIGASGLSQGYLTNIPQFNYNPATDTNLIGAGNLASQETAAQQAAGGGFGSGNMASSIATELAGTLEPQYYNMALQSYNTNQVNPRTTLYNELTGNTGGAGQNTASNLANVYTGSAAATSPYAAGAGSAAASGTLGQSNAYTNALAGISNTGMGAANLYSNYLNSQNLANAMKGLNTSQNTGYNYGGFNGYSSGTLDPSVNYAEIW